MDITISRDVLLSRLETVAGVAGGKPTLPILAHLLWQGDGGTIQLTATDLEQEYRTRVEHEGEGGAFCVQAKRIREILAAMPSKEAVQVKLGEDGRVLVRCGRARFQLQTLPPDNFPAFDAEGQPTVPVAQFSAPAHVLRTLLAPVLPAMGKGDVRYYLNGAQLSGDGTTLRAVASNGHMLAIHETPLETPEFAVIIPRDAAVDLVRYLPDDDTGVAAEIASNTLYLDWGLDRFATRLIDGKFPDWRRVIPARSSGQLVLDRAGVAAVVNRVALVAHEKFRGIGVALGGGALTFTASNAENEEAQESLELAESPPDTWESGFNAAYLRVALAGFGSNLIRWHYYEGGQIVLDTEEGPLRWVVMPMRV